MTTTRTPSLGYASPGAVNQHGGKLPIRECSRCGAQIVWCKSRKTGRSYPVTVRRGHLDQRFYMGHDLHPRDCGEVAAAARAEMRLLDAIHALNVAKSADYTAVANAMRPAMVAAYAAGDEAEGQRIDDLIVAAWDDIDARYDALAAQANATAATGYGTARVG